MRRVLVRPVSRVVLTVLSVALPGACEPSPAVDAMNAMELMPEDLADTGLYADLPGQVIADGVLAFEPQYPLWTDGAAKRRWIRLPAGGAIDARDPDHLVFPVGTRLWKEFSLERRIETRMSTLARDGWHFAVYRWSADERSATLAPECGVRAACESAPGVPYDVPGRADCLACHAAGPDAVLGFTPLQLSADRDPLAPHAQPLPAGAVDLDELVRRRLVRNLPEPLVATPPRIEAASPRERAVLGYLNANCGMCHSSTGRLAGLGLDLSYSLARPGERPAIATTLARPSHFRGHGEDDPRRIAPAAADLGVLPRRMGSRQALAQMPPLGTHRPDAEALELLTTWIRTDLAAGQSVATNAF
ncbi:MAG TPA: hypothetical protein VF530_09080 [Planctomycetota bacterium]